MIERAFREPDLEPSSETQTEVLDGLITWSGRPFKDSVLNQLVNNDIKLVVIFGAPRAGKTTVGNQLGEKIINVSDGQKNPIYLYFDNVLKEKQKELGPVEDWGVNDWHNFSVHHFSSIEERLKTLRNGEVLIAETVSIGKTDRGLTTLELLGKEHPVNAFFVPVIGDPRIDETDVIRRLAVLAQDRNGRWEIPDEELISFYENQGLMITGRENTDEKEAGKRLREAVSRMDRPRQYRVWSNRNRAEVEEITTQYLERGVPQGRERLPELDELIIETFRQRNINIGISEHPRPQQVIDASSDPWVIDRFNILLQYYWGLEKTQRSIPKDRFIPAINLMLQDTSINYLDLNKLEQS